MQIDTPDTTRHTPLKVYCDASVRDNDVGIGFVVKDHVGRILARYNRNLPGKYADSFEAEKMAVVEAMKMVDGVDHAKFYTDQNRVPELREQLPTERFEYVTVEWVGRDQNEGAHIQARAAVNGMP